MIKKVENGEFNVLKNEKWLMFLYLNSENNFNPEHFDKLISKNITLQYVKRTLEILSEQQLTSSVSDILCEVLCWSEVSKCGLSNQRKYWKNKKYFLVDHADASAEIYKEESIIFNEQIYELIKKHGNIGQYIKGEMSKHSIKFNPENKKLTFYLTKCVVLAVSEDLWNKVESKVKSVIYDENILFKNIEDRLSVLINYNLKTNKTLNSYENIDLWYAGPVLQILGSEKSIKLLNYISKNLKPFNDTLIIDFKSVLDKLVYYRDGIKKIDYCMMAMIDEVLSYGNAHGKLSFIYHDDNHVNIDILISESGIGIDSFYRNLNNNDILHQKAVLMVMDYFGYRSDTFDRMGNETTYLETMNNANTDKHKLLKFINSNEKVLEIGPGGGIILEMLEEKTEGSNIYGMDISEEVCKRLILKANSLNKKWNIIQGDFFNIKNNEKYDNIIFCSILHELFSFCETNGKRYNKETIYNAMEKSIGLLTDNGKIIIRDGIANSENKTVVVVFNDISLENLFVDYCNSFKGFDLKVNKIAEFKYEMPYNSMMESLYTVNWGPESLPFEVEEQYGYFTKEDWESVASKFENIKLVQFEEYLQQEYVDHLSQKVKLFDNHGHAIDFPNSNSIIVFQKIS